MSRRGNVGIASGDTRAEVSATWRPGGEATTRVLPRSFYERPVLVVARELLGKVLVHRRDDGLALGRIVETEAYRGPEDLAAHTARGRRTARNESMWGEAGRAYVFRLYGVHWAFNAVTGQVGEPHAVLVRAVEPLPPFEAIERRRGMPRTRREATGGPGRATAALGIDGALDRADLCGGGALAILDAPRCGAIGRSPRVNVDYAGEWAKRPWRFFERGNRYVSLKPRDR
ncbi:MAG: DNA-3-methyladenine glycosylase [Deltaproteobacteria bacterium]|nr:DNA-3-methyladenine glycosylase [Deltaproteobacteria bacterium]